MDTPHDPFVIQSTASQALPDARARYDRFSVMTTAACTSASVSLLTLWLWTPAAPVHVNDTGGVVSVTYEPLDAADRDEPGEATADPGVAPAGRHGSVIPVAQRSRGPSQPAAARTRGAPESSARAIDAEEDAPGIVGAARPSRLAIATQPAGASVTINGVGYGTTPLAIPYLPPGAKRIRVTKAGYDTEERFFTSDAMGATSLRITLRETARAGR